MFSILSQLANSLLTHLWLYKSDHQNVSYCICTFGCSKLSVLTENIFFSVVCLDTADIVGYWKGWLDKQPSPKHLSLISYISDSWFVLHWNVFIIESHSFSYRHSFFGTLLSIELLRVQLQIAYHYLQHRARVLVEHILALWAYLVMPGLYCMR